MVPLQEDKTLGMCKICPKLNPEQCTEVVQMIKRNHNVFSGKPGRTMEAHHHVIMDPEVKVKNEPYQIPVAKRSVQKLRMLELGVIKESYSQWPSPIILVSKPDGTMRFCSDFRKLNKLSQFNAYQFLK